MEYSVETEKRDRSNDRKLARIIAISACILLLTILSFIGYRISNPISKQELAQANEEYVALDAQLLDPGTNDEGGAGSPAKTTKAKTTPAQMKQILTAENSDSHEKSGNSTITNTTDPGNHSSAAQHISDNPFETGGINGEKYSGKTGINAWNDNQTEQTKSSEVVKRYLIEKPNTTTIQSDENCKIVLSVLIDPSGTIVGEPKFVKTGSTTNDITLTNQVIKIVRDQARFNKVNTAKNTKETITIRITAN